MLSILNIDCYSIPLNEVFLLVSERLSADQEPSILPVSPPQAHFGLVWFPDGQVRAPLFVDAWRVVRMNRAPRLFNCLFQSKARIVQPTLIEEIKVAVRSKAPGHRGNCVDYQAKVFFTEAHCLFRSLPVGDVLHSAKHANW